MTGHRLESSTVADQCDVREAVTPCGIQCGLILKMQCKIPHHQTCGCPYTQQQVVCSTRSAFHHQTSQRLCLLLSSILEVVTSSNCRQQHLVAVLMVGKHVVMVVHQQ